MKTKLERIRYDIDELAKISVTQGPGCCRQTYTKEFAEAREYIVKVMKEIGLSVREDAVGNIFGRMEGKNPEAPVIMTGSHFDTVRTGGRFDGLAGVVAAIWNRSTTGAPVCFWKFRIAWSIVSREPDSSSSSL